MREGKTSKSYWVGGTRGWLLGFRALGFDFKVDKDNVGGQYAACFTAMMPWNLVALSQNDSLPSPFLGLNLICSFACSDSRVLAIFGLHSN